MIGFVFCEPTGEGYEIEVSLASRSAALSWPAVNLSFSFGHKICNPEIKKSLLIAAYHNLKLKGKTISPMLGLHTHLLNQAIFASKGELSFP